METLFLSRCWPKGGGCGGVPFFSGTARSLVLNEGAGGVVSSNGSPSSLLRLVLRLRDGFSGESILEN